MKERTAYFATQKESGNRPGKRKEHPGSSSRDGNKSRFSGSKNRGAGSSSQSGQRSNSGPKPLCPTCSKNHFGECWKDTGACLRCGKMDHHIRDCPRAQYTRGERSEPSVQGSRATAAPTGRGRDQTPTGSAAPGRARPGTQGQTSGGQARVYAFTRQEAEAAPDVIRGKISLFNFDVYALIDPRATHSFIASTIASSLSITPDVLDTDLIVSTPLGDCIIVHTVYRDCPI